MASRARGEHRQLRPAHLECQGDDRPEGKGSGDGSRDGGTRK